MADSQQKRELIAQLDRARSKATAYQRELREDLKIKDRVHEVSDNLKYELKDSVDHHRGVWLGTAAIVGLLISKIPPRTKVLLAPSSRTKVPKEAKEAGKAGLLLAVAGWLFSLVRPMLISWGTKRLQQAMTGGSGRGYRRI